MARGAATRDARNPLCYKALLVPAVTIRHPDPATRTQPEVAGSLNQAPMVVDGPLRPDAQLDLVHGPGEPARSRSGPGGSGVEVNLKQEALFPRTGVDALTPVLPTGAVMR